jgi:hypothetical protein
MLFWRCSQILSQQQKHACRFSCHKMLLLIKITIVPMTAPIHILRPILFRLVQGGVLTRLHSRLLQALQNPAAEDVLELAIPQLLFDPSTSPYASFRESIVRHLFHHNTLLRLRLKLAITDFCWVGSFLFPPLFYLCPGSFILPNSIAAQRSASNPENKNEYATVVQDLLKAISHHVLGILVRHINLVADLLTRKLPNTQPIRCLSCTGRTVQEMTCHLCGAL